MGTGGGGAIAGCSLPQVIDAGSGALLGTGETGGGSGTIGAVVDATALTAAGASGGGVWVDPQVILEPPAGCASTSGTDGSVGDMAGPPDTP